jgi:hypothetical protein
VEAESSVVPSIVHMLRRFLTAVKVFWCVTNRQENDLQSSVNSQRQHAKLPFNDSLCMILKRAREPPQIMSRDSA